MCCVIAILPIILRNRGKHARVMLYMSYTVILMLDYAEHESRNSKIIVCFWDELQRVDGERLQLCFSLPRAPVSTNVIYSTHSITGILRYITRGEGGS